MNVRKISLSYALIVLSLLAGQFSFGGNFKPIRDFFPAQARWAGDSSYFDCVGDFSAKLWLSGQPFKRAEFLDIGNQFLAITPIFNKDVPATYAFDRAGDFVLKFDGQTLNASNGGQILRSVCHFKFVNK